MTPHDILTHPLMAMFVTLGSYVLAEVVQKKANGHPLLNPVVIAIAVVVTYVTLLGIPYETYLQHVEVIHYLLGPATVALAIPLYAQLPLIRKSFAAIMVAVGVSCITAAGSAYWLALESGAPEAMRLAIISKSTTTAIAIGIANKINADPSLAIFFVFMTGIVGSLFGVMLLKICRIRDQRAIGLSMGVVCHGLGTARALQEGEQAGAFAALGMSLMGIVSGIALPLLVWALSN